MTFVWGFAVAYLFTGAAFSFLHWRLSTDDQPATPAETAFLLLFWPEVVIHAQPKKEDDDNDRSGT